MDTKYKCPFCWKIFYGLMAYASHTAQVHGVCATDTFNKKRLDKVWNPTRRYKGK